MTVIVRHPIEWVRHTPAHPQIEEANILLWRDGIEKLRANRTGRVPDRRWSVAKSLTFVAICGLAGWAGIILLVAHLV
jgi:hypothetical protein